MLQGLAKSAEFSDADIMNSDTEDNMDMNLDTSSDTSAGSFAESEGGWSDLPDMSAENIGTAMGTAVGGAGGFAIGSLGTPLGVAGGAATGATAGGYLGNQAGEAVDDFFKDSSAKEAFLAGFQKEAQAGDLNDMKAPAGPDMNMDMEMPDIPMDEMRPMRDEFDMETDTNIQWE